eukprot:364345-Chlamydomonas_euryale.AAC.2
MDTLPAHPNRGKPNACNGAGCVRQDMSKRTSERQMVHAAMVPTQLLQRMASQGSVSVIFLVTSAVWQYTHCCKGVRTRKSGNGEEDTAPAVALQLRWQRQHCKNGKRGV